MRKIALIILAAVLMLALAACGTDPLYNNTGSATADEAATEETAAADKAAYDDSFEGMQQYLQDLKLISSKDTDRQETFAEVVGAENGVRYSLSSSAFIEFYEYTDTSKELAKEVLDQVKKDGTFEIAGLDPLTAVISHSGRYMAVYNDKLSYEYQNIISEFEQW